MAFYMLTCCKRVFIVKQFKSRVREMFLLMLSFFFIAAGCLNKVFQGLK